VIPLMQINLSFDEAKRAMLELAGQLDFAQSKAINDVAVLCQTDVRSHMQKTFTLREADFDLNSVKIPKFSRKGEGVGEYFVELVIQDRADYFWKFEPGGTKVGRSGRLVVPTPQIRAPRAATRIPSALRPKALALTDGKGGERTFVIETSGIYQRVGPTGLHRGRPKGAKTTHHGKTPRKRDPRVRFLWKFRDSVPIPANLDFYGTVQETLNREWVNVAEDAIAFAMATAK